MRKTAVSYLKIISIYREKSRSTKTIFILKPRKSIGKSSEKVRKSIGKELTHTGQYNIIKQYDKRRNSRKPKPRSLVDFDISTMKKLMIHRRETNENLYG